MKFIIVLISTEYEDIDKRLESKKVKIKRIEARGWPIEYRNYMKNIICELELEDLTITYKMTEIPETPQQIVFFLYGSQAGWPDWITQTVYSTGNVTTESSDIELDLRELFDGKVTKSRGSSTIMLVLRGESCLLPRKVQCFSLKSHMEKSLY